MGDCSCEGEGCIPAVFDVLCQACAVLVSPAAAVVVLYDSTKHTQRFFLGHDDDVSCLAITPDRAVAASGQVTGTGGKEPRVLVWDVATLRVLAELSPGHGYRSALSLSFSKTGQRIAAVFSGDALALRSAHLLALDDAHELLAGDP